VAASFLSRGIGLLGRSRLAEGEGLLITKTASITMLFMRFAIDAVFVDRGGHVTKVAPGLRPWLPLAASRRAAEVLELPVGTIARSATQVGDELLFEPA
jgi:hypothetical protein